MTSNNNYRLIDTRIDKGVLGLHDPIRPFLRRRHRQNHRTHHACLALRQH